MKTYYTRHGNLNFPLKVGDRSLRIRFISRDNITGYYETGNAEIQTALESNSYFNEKYFLENFFEAPKEEEATPEFTPIEDITTWQMAKEHLQAPPYSVAEKKLDTPKKIIKSAQQEGICFPLLTL